MTQPAMRPVTDPDILAQLNADRAPGDASGGRKRVTDPILLQALNGEPRKRADAAVATERQGRSGSVLDWLPGYTGRIGPSDFERNFVRGTLVGPWLDEAVAGVQGGLHSLSGGRIGAPYDEEVEYQRAANRAVETEAPIASTATQIAGGLFSARPFFNPRQTLPGRIAMGTVVGGAHGFNYGAGSAEGDASERAQAGVEMAPYGAAFGAALPVVGKGAGAAGDVINRFASPTMARVGANLRELPRRMGISASADGAAPETAGARAAAEQILANQAHRAGITADHLQSTLDDMQSARRLHSNSMAQDVLAPMDLDPSLQRLAGSVARQSPEGGNILRGFQEARQTGQPPTTGLLHDQAGLPTRAAMARPQAGDQPAGQYERMRDALKRALLIRDEDFHGHGANAFRTEQSIMAAARKEADELYGRAYQAGQNVNLRPTIEPVLQRWRNAMTDEPAPVARALNRAMGNFRTEAGPVTSLERFDKAKQFLDGEIERLFTSMEGRNRYLGGVLTKLKNELLEAVDQLPSMGPAYQAARSAFGSRMEMRDALEMGRGVFRENSDVAADQFRALGTVGQQKLFRLGLLESFEQHMGRQKRTADVTQVFANPRIQSILSEVIPRTETATGRVKIVGGRPAEFSDRPVRFGRYLENERRMIASRDALGGSQTARNLADDEAFDQLNKIVETVKAGSPIHWTMKAAEAVLNKMFGYRADVAASLARQLSTTDPNARARVINNLRMRMGASRFERFREYMGEIETSLTSVGARTVPQMGPE